MTQVVQFYTNPMSRGQIARWMLEEVGVPYEAHVLDFETAMKAPDYLEINPMGKVPAIVYEGQIVTECAAICVWLADKFPEAGLAPLPNEKADYYRWLFFAAGPVEAAVSDHAAGFVVEPDRQRSFGYGNYDLALDTLETAIAGKDYVCGSRFTAADVYIGAQIDWGLRFGILAERPSFRVYAERLRQRPAYRRAQEIDSALIAKMQTVRQ